jgi:uncharacterized membrane protein YuzA (DUF378 family)
VEADRQGRIFAPRAGRADEAPSRKEVWRVVSRWWYLLVGLGGVALFLLQPGASSPWLQLAYAVVAFGALSAFAWKTIGLEVTSSRHSQSAAGSSTRSAGGVARPELPIFRRLFWSKAE